jgi:serine phosphatase RsbU (regulator of sigma subunit)/predicted enzyme related to lactoylglutathione lyase
MSCDSAHHAHRCSFQPGRQDPYLRLATVTIFVRDQERSREFYENCLGFSVAFDIRSPSGERWLMLAPPDGTALLALAAPKQGAAEHNLIGRPTQISFLTEDIFAKVEEWGSSGVRFHHSPQLAPSGAMCATFEDIDGNSFTLLSLDAMTRELEMQRRAHRERREAERRASEEMELARSVQARLFPQWIPQLPTLECAGLCMQARHIGGDYYDFLDLGRERLGLVVGDVSGKGTAAALLMANLQAHIHNQCATYSSRPFTPFVMDQPQRFLTSINRLFYDSAGEGAYATLFFGEYDDRLQRLRYANCGHLPGLLLRRDGSLDRLDSTSGVLGLFHSWDCAAEERRLLPGDMVALYTDGVTECFNAAGEEFGEARLVDVLRQHRDLAPRALLASVAEYVRRFGAGEQHDDITLLIAKCKDSEALPPHSPAYELAAAAAQMG